MILTPALPSDYEDACRLYQAVSEDMLASGLVQWHWGRYPNAALVRQDISDGSLYVLRQEGVLLCAVSVNRNFEPAYDAVDWHIPGTPGTFHRLAIAPQAQGRGLGRQVLADIMTILRAMGCDCLRCDTFCDNHRALALYEARLGMRRAGEIFFEGEGEGRPFIPLEMAL